MCPAVCVCSSQRDVAVLPPKPADALVLQQPQLPDEPLTKLIMLPLGSFCSNSQRDVAVLLPWPAHALVLEQPQLPNEPRPRVARRDDVVQEAVTRG